VVVAVPVVFGIVVKRRVSLYPIIQVTVFVAMHMLPVVRCLALVILKILKKTVKMLIEAGVMNRQTRGIATYLYQPSI
jgi:hypothetical protein